MNLEPRLSRLVAIAILLAVLALVFRAAVLPAWTTYTRQAQAIEEQREQLGRFRGIALAAERDGEKMKGAAGQTNIGRHVLVGDSPALAAAALQERVKQVVEGNGGRLTSTQVLQPESERGLERVAIQVRVSAGVETLQATLHALETGTPTLVIEDVYVNSRRTRGRTAQAQGVSLDVRFRVIGFMGAGGSEAATDAEPSA